MARKRKRPRQHMRRMKSGKNVDVNKGKKKVTVQFFGSRNSRSFDTVIEALDDKRVQTAIDKNLKNGITGNTGQGFSQFRERDGIAIKI